MTPGGKPGAVRRPRLVPALALASFAAGAVVHAALGEAAWTLQLGAAAAAVLVVWIVRAPVLFELWVALTLVVLVWGGRLWLDEAIGPYDLVLHAAVPMLVAPVAYLAGYRARVLLHPAAAPWPSVVAVATAFGLAVGGAWEVVEYACDATIGTDFVRSTLDTASDLTADWAGSLAGAVALVLWARRESIRR